MPYPEGETLNSLCSSSFAPARVGDSSFRSFSILLPSTTRLRTPFLMHTFSTLCIFLMFIAFLGIPSIDLQYNRNVQILFFVLAFYPLATSHKNRPLEYQNSLHLSNTCIPYFLSDNAHEWAHFLHLHKRKVATLVEQVYLALKFSLFFAGGVPRLLLTTDKSHIF